MSEILLRADGLAHAFDYPLYEEVTLTLHAGESMAIQGRSGSGKSTLLHTLAGFLPPRQGRVTILDQDLYTLDEARRDLLRRQALGIVFQTHYLFKGMTGRQNIEAAALLADKTLDPWLVERLEIDTVIDQKVSELSGGQQQRVSVARVLTRQPRVIFADEPTGNLDRQTADLVMEVLHAYIRRHDAALLVVTHDRSIAQRCAIRTRLEDQHLQMLPAD